MEQSVQLKKSQHTSGQVSISFIIIGRNEGWRLKLCLQSAIKAIDKNKLNAEIIYIDSKSTDNSLQIVNEFSMVRAFAITGTYNAAIARNIGAREAKGAHFVFLDGDMEINSDFLNLIFDNKDNLKYDFVSGNFMNYYYDEKGDFLRKDFYRKIYCEQDTVQYTTGGLFAIKRVLWESVGGMKNKYKKGQDLDLGFRLAKKGIPLLRKKELMANHHTVDYKNKKRLWSSFFDGSYIYPRSVLYRDHLFNTYVIKRMISSDPTWILLILMLSTILVTKLIFPVYLYVSLTGIAVLFSMRKTGFKGFFNRIVTHIFRDIINLFALFMFHPKGSVLSYKKANEL